MYIIFLSPINFLLIVSNSLITISNNLYSFLIFRLIVNYKSIHNLDKNSLIKRLKILRALENGVLVYKKQNKITKYAIFSHLIKS